MSKTDDTEATEAELRTLVHDFIWQKQCAPGLALHVVQRVAQALQHTEVAGLLDHLAALEAETKAEPGEYAGEGISRTRLLGAFYDIFVVSLLPGGHAACQTILATTAKRLGPAPGEQRH